MSPYDARLLRAYAAALSREMTRPARGAISRNLQRAGWDADIAYQHHCDALDGLRHDPAAARAWRRAVVRALL